MTLLPTLILSLRSLSGGVLKNLTLKMRVEDSLPKTDGGIDDCSFFLLRSQYLLQAVHYEVGTVMLL